MVEVLAARGGSLVLHTAWILYFVLRYLLAAMRYAFTTTIKDGKMDEYLHYHDHIWPEVCRGLRAAGVTQLTIFRAPQTATLFLYVTTAGATDLGEATGPRSRYREDPKCQEWEELMDADFHGGWTALEEVHASDREWVGALR